MNLIVILLKDKKVKFENAGFGTGKWVGPAHDKKFIGTGELYIYRILEDKLEVVIATFAAGQWVYCIDEKEGKNGI